MVAKRALKSSAKMNQLKTFTEFQASLCLLAFSPCVYPQKSAQKLFSRLSLPCHGFTLGTYRIRFGRRAENVFI